MAATTLSALFALSGSLIGALGGIVTTWLTMFAQDRAHRTDRMLSRRESLYGEFIDEASRIFGDALSHKLDDVSKLVRLYGLLSKLRLFAPASVLLIADKVMERILQTYEMPEIDVHVLVHAQYAANLDVLRAFSEACRRDLVSAGPRSGVPG